MKQEHNFRNITLNDIHLTNCIISSIRQKPNLPDNMRVLEVGCGSGTFLLYMIDILSKTFPIAPPNIIRKEKFLKPFVLIDINAINITIISIKTVKKLLIPRALEIGIIILVSWANNLIKPLLRKTIAWTNEDGWIKIEIFFFLD